jgi:Na+-transporting NADH:ubiquinone oxidoreductase subunit NqrC
MYVCGVQMSRALLFVIAIIACVAMVNAQGLKPIEAEKAEHDNQREIFMINGTAVLKASICSSMYIITYVYQSLGVIDDRR